MSQSVQRGDGFLRVENHFRTICTVVSDETTLSAGPTGNDRLFIVIQVSSIEPPATSTSTRWKIDSLGGDARSFGRCFERRVPSVRVSFRGAREPETFGSGMFIRDRVRTMEISRKFYRYSELEIHGEVFLKEFFIVIRSIDNVDDVYN